MAMHTRSAGTWLNQRMSRCDHAGNNDTALTVGCSPTMHAVMVDQLKWMHAVGQF